jgi:hypothetical protein
MRGRGGELGAGVGVGVGLFFLAVAAEAHGVGQRQDVVVGRLKKPKVLPLLVEVGLVARAARLPRSGTEWSSQPRSRSPPCPPPLPDPR